MRKPGDTGADLVRKEGFVRGRSITDIVNNFQATQAHISFKERDYHPQETHGSSHKEYLQFSGNHVTVAIQSHGVVHFTRLTDMIILVTHYEWI